MLPSTIEEQCPCFSNIWGTDLIGPQSMWAILVSGYCSNLYPVLDREAHTMWLSLHFLTMIIGPKHRIEMKEFVLSLTLQSVLLSKKKPEQIPSKGEPSSCQANRQVIFKKWGHHKRAGGGVCLMCCWWAQKACVCFITSGALIKEIFMKSSLIFLDNSKSNFS